MNPVVLACVLVIFAATFSTSAYIPLAPFLASRRQVGLLLSSQGLASCLALVPAGLAVDSVGGARVLRHGMAAFAGSIFFTSVSTGFAPQLLGRVVNGASGSVIFCAGMALIMERFQEPFRAEYVGISIGMGTLGNLAGAPLAGYVFASALAQGLNQPQALALLPAGILLALSYVALKRVPKVAFEPKEPLLQEPKGQDDGICLRFFGVYAAVGVRSWVISMALACLFGAQSALLCAGALELHARGFSTAEIGVVPVPAGFLQAICARLGGRMSSTPSWRVALMVLSPLTLAAALLCSVLASTLSSAGSAVLPIVVTLGVGSATQALADAPSISLMADLASLHGRGYGEAVTASELAVCSGQAIGPSLGAMILQMGGFDCLCVVLAAWAILVSVACAAFLQHVEHSPVSNSA